MRGRQFHPYQESGNGDLITHRRVFNAPVASGAIGNRIPNQYKLTESFVDQLRVHFWLFKPVLVQRQLSSG